MHMVIIGSPSSPIITRDQKGWWWGFSLYVSNGLALSDLASSLVTLFLCRVLK